MGEARRRRLLGAGFNVPGKQEKNRRKEIARAKELEPLRSLYLYKFDCGKDEECPDCKGLWFNYENGEWICIRDEELSD